MIFSLYLDISDVNFVKRLNYFTHNYFDTNTGLYNEKNKRELEGFYSF